MTPSGLVRSGDYRTGTPLTSGHVFGTPVNEPEPFGNVEPQANTTLNSNPVTLPKNFGHGVGFSLQAVPPIILAQQGGTGTTSINVTLLGGFTGSVTLSYSGAPSGVTAAFAPGSTTTTSTATVTVGGSVPLGKYTITVTGTSGTETENTNIHLVVTAATSSSVPSYVSGAFTNFTDANGASTTYSPTVGNTVVVFMNFLTPQATAGTITDSASNALTAGPFKSVTSNISSYSFYYTVPSSGITAFNSNSWGSATDKGTFQVLEYAHASSVNTSLANNTNNGDTNAPTLTVTTSNPNSLIVGILASSSTVTITQGTSRIVDAGNVFASSVDSGSASSGASITLAGSTVGVTNWCAVSLELTH